MPDWYGTAFEFPGDAEACLRKHYANFEPKLNKAQIEQIVGDVKMATIQTTVHRKELEAANLNRLSLTEEETAEYTAFAGQLALAGESVLWFAQKAARAFEENRDPDLKKISLELGGNRQYGLWSVTKQVDEIAWELQEQLQGHSQVLRLKHYAYEGKTPIQYRFWPRVNGAWDLDEVNSGNVQRRRAVDDITVKTEGGPIEVKPFKQANGNLVFDAIEKARVEELMHRYRSLAPKERHEKRDAPNKADAYAGTIFREAIRSKAYSPHSVAPIGAVIVMVAHRPEWAPSEPKDTKQS